MLLAVIALVVLSTRDDSSGTSTSSPASNALPAPTTTAPAPSTTAAAPDTISGTYTLTSNLQCGSAAQPTSNQDTETLVVTGTDATVTFPGFDPAHGVVTTDGTSFSIAFDVSAAGPEASLTLDGTITNGGDDLTGTGGMTPSGVGGPFTCGVDFTGHRGSSSPAETSATTTPDPSAGPPCTIEAVQQALVNPGTVDPDHAPRCQDGWAAAGVLDPPYVSYLVILRADGDAWTVDDDASLCEGGTVPHAILVWGCNGDPP